MRGKKKELTKALEDDSTDKMKQVKIATKTIRETRTKNKETLPSQPQSSLRVNPSSVRTPPNPNLQQSVDFASHQKSKFTLEQG